jgi:hypothetical protein
MFDFLEILKYILPALVVLIAVERVLRWQFRKTLDFQQQTLKGEQLKQLLPVRLQAAERLALFLERISPEAMIHRLSEPGMGAKSLHMAMLASIRGEYEHNMAQQIYLKAETWDSIRSAKEDISSLVNQAANGLNGDATALDYSRQLLELLRKRSIYPTAPALSQLRRETERL